MVLSVSERGLAFVAAREACVLTAYRDTQMLAIGFGQNHPTLKEGDTITLDRAIELFVLATKERLASLSKTFAGVDLLPQHVDALYSVAYNIGTGALARNVPLVSAVKEFRTDPRNRVLRDKAGYQIIRANFADATGPFNLSRRCREALVFVSGDYGDLSTMQFWPAGKSPKNVPPDPPTITPMPRFLP